MNLLITALIAPLMLPQGEPPQVNVQLKSSVGKVNGTILGTATVSFPSGLHGYQNPPTKDYQIPITISVDGKGFLLKANYPKGVIKEFLGEKTAVYEGQVKVPFAFTLPSKPGTYTITFSLGYQMCNDQSCFPPGAVTVTKKVSVLAKAATKKNGG